MLQKIYANYKLVICLINLSQELVTAYTITFIIILYLVLLNVTLDIN